MSQAPGIEDIELGMEPSEETFPLDGEHLTRAEIEKLCVNLIEAEDILGQFAEALDMVGVAGETVAGKLGFLVLLTRFFTRVVSAVFAGASGSGESRLLDSLLGLRTRHLDEAIRRYIAEANRHSKPFLRTNTADEILATVARFCQRISHLGHQLALFSPGAILHTLNPQLTPPPAHCSHIPTPSARAMASARSSSLHTARCRLSDWTRAIPRRTNS